MSVLRFLAHLLIVLSVSGVLPPTPAAHASTASGSRDRRGRLAMRLGLRLCPAANGAVTAGETSDLRVASRSRLSTQPGECVTSELPVLLVAAGSPVGAHRDALQSPMTDGWPLRGPPPATSFR